MHAGLKFGPLLDVDRQVLEAYLDYLKREKELQEISNVISKNLGQFTKKLDRMAALIRCATAGNTGLGTEPRPRYLH